MVIYRFPLVRIAFFFVLGIFFGYQCPLSLYGAGTAGVVLLLLTVSLMLFAKTRKKLIAIALYLWFFSLGVSNVLIRLPDADNLHYLHFLKEPKDFVAADLTVTERLKPSAKYERYYVEVKRLGQNPTSGKMLLQFPSHRVPQILLPGDRLWTSGLVRTYQPPFNPGQFDYGKYLARKSVYATVTVERQNIKILPAEQRPLRYYAAILCLHIQKTLQKGPFGKKELPVIMALLLGQQQDISTETVKDYQYSGAVHILSVSGLHVGFLLSFVNLVLGRLPKTRRWNLMRFSITLLVLWGFALIAGLSPSVVRAATMFSFIACGLYLRRDTPIFHTLAISLFLILAIEPGFLFDVGFQLSYLSLFFIIWLQPLLTRLYEPGSRLVQKLWDLTTVSFAAQLGVLPLSLFYFHQFPGLFFVTNLFAIPLTALMMGLGLAVMVPAAFGICLYWPSVALDRLTRLLNGGIHIIASQKDYLFKDVPMTFHLMLLLYLLIFSGFLYVEKPLFKRAISFVAVAIGLQFFLFFHRQERLNKREVLVYSKARTTLVLVREGLETRVVKDRRLHLDQALIAIKPYLMAEGLSETGPPKNANLLYLNETSIFLMDSTGVYPKKSPDVLILTQSPKINLDRLLGNQKPKIVIADLSNYKNLTMVWANSCRKQKIPFHATAEKGYCVIR